MIEIFDDLPGWRFDIREVSAGVFRAAASGSHGEEWVEIDTDEDDLIQTCRKRALGAGDPV